MRVRIIMRRQNKRGCLNLQLGDEFMSEDDNRIDVSNVFDNIDDLPAELQERIKLFHAKISERKISREQSQETQSSP